MDDQRKAKQQLINELAALRQKLAKPEQLDADRKQAEETLVETSQLLGTILDHTHMLVAYLDPQFNFVRVNRAYAEADEREVSFFPGKNHFDLFPNEENEMIFKRVVKTGEPYFASAKSFEYDEHPERGVSYWDWSLILIRDSGGAVTGLVLTLADVTKRKRAEEALLESESRLRAIMANIPLVMWAIDNNGLITFSEGKGLKGLGLEPGEIVGQSLFDLYRDAPQVQENHRRALKGEAFRADIEMGGLVFDCWHEPVHNENGEVTGAIGVAVDITERKQIEGRLDKEFTATTAVISDMLRGEVDDKETEKRVLDACLTATDSAYGQIGVINEHGKYDTTAYSGQALQDCAFPEALAWEMSTGMTIRGIWGWPLLHGESLLCNDLLAHPDRVGFPEGHASLQCFLGVPLKRDGEVVGMVAVANKPGGYTEVDKATLIRLASVISVSREQRLTLEKVKEYASQLQASNKELEAFSYSVSHDLRAPLRAIDGFGQALIEDCAGQLDDEGKRLLGIIRENAKKMGQLIDDLLAFSRLGQKKIMHINIDMSSLAKTVHEELQNTVPERPQVAIKRLPSARGDWPMIHQVWMNLLSNAVKFTRPVDTPVIEVGGTSNENENIYYVKDNGAGFDMKYVDKLFGVFQRLHSASDFEGTGVGLALIQRIIHRHGGRVWAEGKVNKGATFYFTLPKNEGDVR